MSIEEFLIGYLGAHIDAPVSGDVPSTRPERFVTLEKTGSGHKDHIHRADIAVQSWAGSRSEASALNELVIAAMEMANAEPEISRCALTNDYNFPELETKSPRYQAVFEVVHFL